MQNTYRIVLMIFALAILQSCKTPKPAYKKPPPTTDFIELARVAYPPEGGINTEYRDYLWAELYGLQRWYFLTAPATPPAKSPAAQTIGGKGWYLAFTDAGKLKYYAKVNKNLDAKGNAPYIAMTPKQAMEFARANGSGPVYGVRFNEGQKAGWSAPMHDLTLLPEYLRGKGML